ncbi:hypothetical protein [Micromonospora sp. SL4-19]|uniref:hypothetical protein n=1 Tax=Micromonospora sp. SL4-19 TaxID=3399129 RepID=UPI003A4DC247
MRFAGDRALTIRVVSVCDRPTYAGWVWLTGYVIKRRGNATARREIYVQLAGLHRATITRLRAAPALVITGMTRATAEHLAKPRRRRAVISTMRILDILGADSLPAERGPYHVANDPGR